MTNFKLILIAAITACTTSKPAPESIWDFSARDLAAAPTTPVTATSPKALVRRAIDQLQPELLKCTAGTAGTIDLQLRIAVEADQPAGLEDVSLAYPDDGARDCLRDVFTHIDVSRMTAHEAATWVVHFPLVVR